MARKNYTAEQIIGMLREAEVRLRRREDRRDMSWSGYLGTELLPLAA
jgi:hypothetical protein